ncbi:hypothetical protein EYF80_054595 [Liparis tanakae]|uniref:Uncharacterized protein n=1 Tax=Liparis tanakae TaxID=230148 RepID=A0A4Z2F1Z7_9TELE|nr:hypothetical protein EYF80_054595 [Liparis tanakae]
MGVKHKAGGPNAAHHPISCIALEDNDQLVIRNTLWWSNRSPSAAVSHLHLQPSVTSTFSPQSPPPSALSHLHLQPSVTSTSSPQSPPPSALSHLHLQPSVTSTSTSTFRFRARGSLHVFLMAV